MEEESMSYPRFARPDLCSIRTADEQDELAEAFRSGFGAAGYPFGDDYPPVPLTSGIDRAIRLSTAAAVLAVAGIAVYISYWHAYTVVRAHGENGITARLEPATIDGQVYASSMVAVRGTAPGPGPFPGPAGSSAWGSRLPSRRTWPRAGPTARPERRSRPGQQSASWAPMSSWSG